MEKELNYTELGLLIKEFVEAQGETKQCKEALTDYLMNNDAFDSFAEIVSDLVLLLKNP